MGCPLRQVLPKVLSQGCNNCLRDAMFSAEGQRHLLRVKLFSLRNCQPQSLTLVPKAGHGGRRERSNCALSSCQPRLKGGSGKYYCGFIGVKKEM